MLLTNHAIVLLLIAEDPAIRIGSLGQAVGISKRSAQMIVSDLCRAGYVVRRRVGRCNEYAVVRSMPLRREVMRERSTLADLLGIIRPE